MKKLGQVRQVRQVGRVLIGSLLVGIAAAGCGQPVGSIDGIESSSRNVEFPPQEDFDGVECSSGPLGGPQSVVSITNRSPETSTYSVLVVWADASGARISESRRWAQRVAPGEAVRLEVNSWPVDGEVANCSVVEINRHKS